MCTKPPLSSLRTRSSRCADGSALAQAEEWQCAALAEGVHDIAPKGYMTELDARTRITCHACTVDAAVHPTAHALSAVVRSALGRRPRDPNREHQLAAALIGDADGRAAPSDGRASGARWSEVSACSARVDAHGSFSCVLERVTCCDGDGALIVHRRGLLKDVLHADGIAGHYKWAAPELIAVRETAVPYGRSECAVTVRTGVLWAAGADDNLSHLLFESVPALFAQLQAFDSPFIEYSEHPLRSSECPSVSTQSSPVRSLRVQHVRGDGRAPLLLRYRRRFFQRLATSSQQQLMAMFTAAPIDLSFQDIRWRGKAVCFERLLALQPFDPAAAAAAGLRRGSHRIDAFLAPLIGELRRHLIDRRFLGAGDTGRAGQAIVASVRQKLAAIPDGRAPQKDIRGEFRRH